MLFGMFVKNLTKKVCHAKIIIYICVAYVYIPNKEFHVT